MLVLWLISTASFLMASEPSKSSVKGLHHRRKLSQEEMDKLAKTLGADTARLFVTNATRTDEEKREAEKGGQAPAKVHPMPAQVSPTSKADLIKKEKAHNTKTLRAWCCGLSNEE